MEHPILLRHHTLYDVSGTLLLSSRDSLLRPARGAAAQGSTFNPVIFVFSVSIVSMNGSLLNAFGTRELDRLPGRRLPGQRRVQLQRDLRAIRPAALAPEPRSVVFRPAGRPRLHDRSLQRPRAALSRNVRILELAVEVCCPLTSASWPLIPIHSASCGLFAANSFCLRADAALADSIANPAGGSGEAFA